MTPALSTSIEGVPGWVTADMPRAQFFVAWMLTHMAEDFYTSPEAQLDDGAIHISMGGGMKCQLTDHS